VDKYVVMVVDTDEDSWESLSDVEKQRTYDADGRFLALLAERNGKVVGGQELAHSRRSRSLTRDAGGKVLVTDGPYAETVEQISGFYVVECDDLETLTAACREMLPVHHRLEIRPVPSGT
jgi:hypothetical protein